MVDTPVEGVGEECRTTGLVALSLLWVEHGAGPVSLFLLACGHGLSQLAIACEEEVAMTVALRHVGEHLCQSCHHPSVASCPEVFLSLFGLVCGIDIASVAIIELCLGVEHETVGIAEVVVEFVEILHILGDLIEFGEHWHDHIEGVGPPPVVVSLLAHHIVHHLFCPTDLIVVGVHLIHVEIGLEANLPVAEEHMLHRLAILFVEPFRAVGLRRPTPLVVTSPFVAILEVSSASGEFVSLHVSGEIRSVVPERAYLRGISRLPLVVDFFHDVHRWQWHCLCLFLCLCRDGGWHHEQHEGNDSNSFFHCL